MNNDLYKLLLNPLIFAENYKKDQKQIEDDIDTKKKNRIFTNKQKELCWSKAKIVPNRDPDRWRYDAVGNLVLKNLRGCHGPLCHEYDHIIPFSKGGETSLDNCQILQTSINKYKSNKTDIEFDVLKNNSSKLNMSEFEMDLIEKAVYGNIKRYI